MLEHALLQEMGVVILSRGHEKLSLGREILTRDHEILTVRLKCVKRRTS
jgi:hypothetical protein